MLISCLIAIGAWGALHISGHKLGTQEKSFTEQASQSSWPAAKENQDNRRITVESQDEPSDEILAKLENLLLDGLYENAANLLNDNYSLLTQQQLDEARDSYKKLARKISKKENPEKKRLWQSAVEVFNDLDAWSNLAKVLVELEEWNQALDALMTASQLENDSQSLINKLNGLTRVSAHIRAQLENQNDDIAIKALYQRLYDAHPSFPRFQLDLAQANIKLGQHSSGRSLLEPLQYDPDLGEVAKQVLVNLEQRLASLRAEAPSRSTINNADILVPLQRLGTSLIADVKIRHRNVRLLLDTGASITALDNGVIKTLRLRPTGQSINLNTANGVTRAQLYKAENIQLGQFNLKGHTIAGIELGSNNQFSGLLGTDVLNSLSRDYSFIIDNSRNALVFKPKLN